MDIPSTLGAMPGRATRGVAAIVAVAVAAVAVLAAWGYLLTTWPPTTDSDGASASARLDPANPGGRSSETAGTSPSESPADGSVLAVVLGDTFTTGVDEVPGPEWPEVLADELGWEVEVDAVPGSGYLVAGAGTDFVDRVEAVIDQEPDVVLLAGGVSDLGRPVEEIRGAAAEVVQRLESALPETEVVVLSPFSNGPPGELTTALTDALEEVAAANEAEFVDVSGMLPLGQGLIAADGVHPSEQGHEELARQIAERLGSLELG